MEYKNKMPLIIFRWDYLRSLALDKAYQIALGMIFVVGLINRILLLDDPIVGDEAWTYIDYVSKSFLEIISQNYVTNNHILHSLLASGAMKIFGDSLLAMRFPAFVAGVLILPVGFITAFRFFGKETALITTALLAVSAPLIYYSAVARGYSIMILATLGLLLAGDRLLQSGQPAAWFIWIISAVVGLYTVPTMLYPVGGISLWMFWAFCRQSGSQQQINLRRLIGASLIIILLTIGLYMPVIIVSGLDGAMAIQSVQPISWFEFIRILPMGIFGISFYLHNGFSFFLSAILLLGFLLNYFGSPPKENNQIIMAIPLFLAGWIIIVSLLYPMNLLRFFRTWLFILPLYLMIAVNWWIVYLKKKPTFYSKRFLMLIVGFTISLSIFSKQYSSFRLVRSSLGIPHAANILEEELTKDDIVIAEFENYYAIKYYFLRKNIQHNVIDGLKYWQPPIPPGRIFLLFPNAGTYGKKMMNYDQLGEGAQVEVISELEVVPGGAYLIEIQVFQP